MTCCQSSCESVPADEYVRTVCRPVSTIHSFVQGALCWRGALLHVEEVRACKDKYTLGDWSCTSVGHKKAQSMCFSYRTVNRKGQLFECVVVSAAWQDSVTVHTAPWPSTQTPPATLRQVIKQQYIHGLCTVYCSVVAVTQALASVKTRALFKAAGGHPAGVLQAQS